MELSLVLPIGDCPDRQIHVNPQAANDMGLAEGDYVEQGNDAFAILGGASLVTEKTYLLGKFARVCLKTRQIDFNGRLCMVSAGAANNMCFGIDRAAKPWSDVLGAEVVWISGANIAECAPITTNYVWQARENGARIICVDPRITPLAATMNAYLGGDESIAWPAAIASGGCFAVNLWLLRRLLYLHGPNN